MIFNHSFSAGRPIPSPTSAPLRVVWLLSVLVFLINYTYEVLAFNHLYQPQQFLLALLQLTFALWALVEVLLLRQGQTLIPLRGLRIALVAQLLIGAARYPLGRFPDIDKDIGLPLVSVFVPLYFLLFLTVSKLLIDAFSFMERQRSELLQTEIEVRLRAEEAVKRSESLFRAFFNLPLVGTAIISRSKGWIAINDRTCEILGYPRESLLRNSWEELVHPDDLAAEAGLFDQVLHGEIDSCSLEMRFVRPDGRSVPVLLSGGSSQAADAARDSIHVQILDLTERKRRERELEQTRQALLAAKEETEIANRALQAANRDLYRLSTTDALTGAWNRRRLEESLADEIERLKRYGHPVSLLVCDIDFFKKINDTHGHAVGDQVLIRLAAVIRAALRPMDSLTRWGGEEFVVLTPNETLESAVAIAERLRAMIAESDFPAVGRVTVSVGVAECMPDESWEQWFERADAALYRAKAEGRDRIRTAPEAPVRAGIVA